MQYHDDEDELTSAQETAEREMLYKRIDGLLRSLAFNPDVQMYPDVLFNVTNEIYDNIPRDANWQEIANHEPVDGTDWNEQLRKNVKSFLAGMTYDVSTPDIEHVVLILAKVIEVNCRFIDKSQPVSRLNDDEVSGEDYTSTTEIDELLRQVQVEDVTELEKRLHTFFIDKGYKIDDIKPFIYRQARELVERIPRDDRVFEVEIQATISTTDHQLVVAKTSKEARYIAIQAFERNLPKDYIHTGITATATERNHE